VISDRTWPTTADELVAWQEELARRRVRPWFPAPASAVGACVVRFPRGATGAGGRGDRGWAAAVGRGETAVVRGEAGAPYMPGLLALREGPLLEAAVLDLPTVGVTHRPLLAAGAWPANRRGAVAPLRIGEETVGCWLRVRAGVRPLAVHPAWRTDLDTAIAVVLGATARVRTPEPLRRARTAARRARAADEG
jgi:deoxyribonuclease V